MFCPSPTPSAGSYFSTFKGGFCIKRSRTFFPGNWSTASLESAFNSFGVMEVDFLFIVPFFIFLAVSLKSYTSPGLILLRIDFLMFRRDCYLISALSPAALILRIPDSSAFDTTLLSNFYVAIFLRGELLAGLSFFKGGF